MSAYAIGIDTGGTYTDAVLLDVATRRVVAWNKERTTPHDLSLGVHRALTGLLAGSVRPADIRGLSVSTTLATNAVVESKDRNRANALVDKRATDNGSGLIRDQVFNVKNCAGKGIHVWHLSLPIFWVTVPLGSRVEETS